MIKSKTLWSILLYTTGYAYAASTPATSTTSAPADTLVSIKNSCGHDARFFIDAGQCKIRLTELESRALEATLHTGNLLKTNAKIIYSIPIEKRKNAFVWWMYKKYERRQINSQRALDVHTCIQSTPITADTTAVQLTAIEDSDDE